MKFKKLAFTCLGFIFFFLLSMPCVAADFDWMRNMNITAQADSSGFRARLSTRFNLGDTQVKVILGNVKRPADAYMALRLGEISSKPTSYVIQRYKALQGKGWGVLARDLGIKPGSQQFKALKQGHDLKGMDQNKNHYDKGKNKSKNKGHSKG
jgi:hypothetical protein